MKTDQTTVGELRVQLDRLPDSAPMFAEAPDGSQYEIRRVVAIGTKTDDPGLLLKIERVR